MTESRHSSRIVPPGAAAPDFELHSAPDGTVRLADLRGRPVVLAFYPADWSPVCSDQMVLYQELMPEFKKYNAQLTSDGRYCLAGITRANVLDLCRDNGIPARETTFSLTDVYAAREAFVTGTFAGVVPVRSVDGRTIGDGRRGPVVERLQALYSELVDADVASRVAP